MGVVARTTDVVFMTSPALEALLPIALDITSALSAQDRSRRVVDVVREVLTCDAVALLRLEGNDLVPVAASGLSPEVFGRRLALDENPRLAEACLVDQPVRFAPDDDRPDPLDGFMEAAPHGHDLVHSCVACPLRVEGDLVGVLTIDSLRPGRFDGVEDVFLQYLTALAAAALRIGTLVDTLEKEAEHRGLVARDLVQDAMERDGARLIGRGRVTQRLMDEIDLVASADLPVLVTGETGVGKELVVRRLHAHSRRANQPLVYLNCAAIPEGVVESELFGHVKGAFTGAASSRLGKFRVADGATLFLDEIGELPLHVQPKLLRALQEGEVQCVGSDKPEHVDVRILAATNRDLNAEVAAGRFRADLLHRLDVCRIAVAPLRAHAEDIPDLAGHFADRTRRRLGCGPIRYGPDAHEALRTGSWPGNVRELENVVSRGILRATQRSAAGELVHVCASDLDVSERPAVRADVALDPEPPRPSIPMREALSAYQIRLIQEAVEHNAGNWSAAARDLDLDRGNLHHLARRLGLK
tara:strand:+ start:5917 stop:7500 length:1584 start_codon:yes stop_codon:yes gene_type:complete